MYSYPVDNSTRDFYQGDIIENFPSLLIDSSNFNIVSKKADLFKITKKGSLGLTDNKDEIIAVETRRQKVMILSQSCDIDQRDTIIFAPIYEISKAIQENRINANQVENIRNRKLGYWFYLPRLEGVLEESYVDFQIMHYLPKDLIVNNLCLRSLSLSDWGRHHLGWAISTFFGRPIKSR